MPNQRAIYITVTWQEKGPLRTKGNRLWQKGRQVCKLADYPEKVPCSNPKCEGGGFKIGDRIAALIASGEYNEQNSLICSNAIYHDRTKRCLHIILYSITCIRPFQRETSSRRFRQQPHPQPQHA